ncbi:unnamed protein product [Urochloa decumbens]|uniref:PGG domain-containing protein n=1 Tax=Urochloa decumbens TaxID=240449 RepID=A0ABC9AMY7_9POAL
MHGQCDILEVTSERNTVLHVAAEQGHNELIRELYLRFREQAGLLLSHQNSALDTPLHCAARAGHVRAVEVIVQLAATDRGENIMGCKNEAGDTALHLAARYGHGDAVEALVSAALEPAAEPNHAGVSPLYLAVMSGSVQAVRAITTSCKDASSLGPGSQNALHAAVFQSSEMVGLLLEWRPALADQVDSSGSTPLHFAASIGDHAMVHAILRAAPQRTLYRKDSAGGLSALHVAARMGHYRVVEDMLVACPDAAELRDGGGATFVHAATAREKGPKVHHVVSLAIENPKLRGLLDAQDRDGNTPLHLAVAAGARPASSRPCYGRARCGPMSLLTMVKLVVALVAFGAQLRPQRADHMNKWSGREMAQWIDKMSESLAVVASLFATAAFAAGFNMPGGYRSEETGEASLAGKATFKCFVSLDAVAVAMSVIAVILLVYGKASRSAGSFNSFVWALQLMWASLNSLMLAFYAALVAVMPRKIVYQWLLLVIYLCIFVLKACITVWVAPATRWRTIWRFVQQRKQSKLKYVVVKRQYPLAGSFVLNFCLFKAISFLGILGLHVIFGLCVYEVFIRGAQH